MGLTPVENRNLVSPIERVTNLKRTGEPRAAEDQNAQRLCHFLLGAKIEPKSQSDCAPSGGRDLDEFPSGGRYHVRRQHDRRFLVAQPMCSPPNTAASPL